MGLLGSIVGLVSGLKSDKKTNKLNKEELALQRDLANRQIDVSKYIEELSKQIVGRNYNFADPYGGGVSFDPATQTYKTTLNPAEKAIQDTSYQLQQRQQQAGLEGLNDYEKLRKQSVGETGTALANALAFRRGVGRADEGRIASQLRADRTGAVNAGYDDAARAAQTLQLRTGNASLGDALSALARDRARAVNTTVGSPEIEAMQLADQTNQAREEQLYKQYGLFGDEARGILTPQASPYADKAYNQYADAQKFDLSKYDLGLGGSSNAAATIGNAATGEGAAYGQFMKNRIANPFGKFAMGLDSALEDAVKQIFAGGMG